MSSPTSRSRRRYAPRRRFFSTDMVPNNRRPCGTCATPFWTSTSGRAFVTVSPPSTIVPDVARTSPLTTPRSVDLPAPFAPTSATSSPLATSRSIPNRTGPAPKPAVRPRTSRRGSGLEPFRIAFAEVGLDHALIAKDDLGLSLGQDVTALEDNRAAADPDDHAHHVLDKEHCHA